MLLSGPRRRPYGIGYRNTGAARALAGAHRGSIFRLLVGEALIRRDNVEAAKTWGIGGDPGAAAERVGCTAQEVRQGEYVLEACVSQYIGGTPFSWLPIDDLAGPASVRGYLERNSIALLSNFERPPLDPPSHNWLGHCSGRERVQRSGLWNNNHVHEQYDSRFLTELEKIVNFPSQG